MLQDVENIKFADYPGYYKKDAISGKEKLHEVPAWYIDRKDESPNPTGKARKVLKVPRYIRKIRSQDIVDINPQEMMNQLDKEWLAYIEDFKYGIFHPLSKTVMDYQLAHIKKDFYYKDLKRNPQFVNQPPGHENPAFDREALKDPGTFTYWGKPDWNDDTSTMHHEPYNPFPAVTARGLSMYIENLLVYLIRDVQRIKEESSKCVFLGTEQDGLFTNELAPAKSEAKEKKK